MPCELAQPRATLTLGWQVGNDEAEGQQKGRSGADVGAEPLTTTLSKDTTGETASWPAFRPVRQAENNQPTTRQHRML
ncbi:hypothetical protein HaLaN_07969, partial [Haematococcus lacustris]